MPTACSHKNGTIRPPTGFSLVELMIAVSLFGLVIAGSLGAYIMCQKTWRATALDMDTAHMADLAIQRLVCGTSTNSGLRSASMIMLDTNVGGHPYYITNYYWLTNSIPPPEPDNPVHYVHVNCMAGGNPTRDGSWRLTFSNAFEGVGCIDYNIKQRNLLFCPDTNQTGAARQKRQLICNYVSSATATLDATNRTVAIQLTVWKQDGVFVSSNQANALIKLRL